MCSFMLYIITACFSCQLFRIVLDRKAKSCYVLKSRATFSTNHVLRNLIAAFSHAFPAPSASQHLLALISDRVILFSVFALIGQINH